MNILFKFYKLGYILEIAALLNQNGDFLEAKVKGCNIMFIRKFNDRADKIPNTTSEWRDMVAGRSYHPEKPKEKRFYIPKLPFNWTVELFEARN